LDEIFRQYGYFHEDLTNAYVSGAEGVARVVRMMEGLRERLPTELGGTPVVEVIDRKTGTAIDPKSGSVIRNVEGAKGDVLVFVLSEDAHTRVTIRPSGTEPKIKYYGAIHRAVPAGMSDADFAGLKSDAQALLDTYAKSLIAEAEKRSS
jgi:phosphoglucomutase